MGKSPEAMAMPRRDWDMFINNAALIATEGLVGTTDGSNQLRGPPVKPAPKKKGGPKPPKPTSIPEVISQEIKTGIFAWAVLLGYGLFGEPFIQRARGKGFAIPNGLRQKFIVAAKDNGHDLGFLVNSNKQFGDGLFGKQAMAWWKAQGF